MNDGGGNGASCGGIKERTDTTKLSDIVIASFGDGRNLVREGKMFIKDEAKVASRVGTVEELRILSRYCLSPMSKNSVLEELRVWRLAVIQEEICCRAFCR